jgi:hypothetical protein
MEMGGLLQEIQIVLRHWKLGYEILFYSGQFLKTDVLKFFLKDCIITKGL